LGALSSGKRKERQRRARKRMAKSEGQETKIRIA